MLVSLRRLPLLPMLVAFMVAAGCARSPEARKARHLDRGDKYYGKKEYKEAVIEYRNALRIDAGNGRAIKQLGLAHHELGEFGEAYRYLVKAQEGDPNDIEVRARLGTIYLLAGKPDQAREEALFQLSRDPNRLEALELLVGAVRTKEDAGDAAKRFEAARAALGGNARYHIALAALHIKQADPARAERALQEAVAKDPKSVEAHAALGQYLASQGKLPEAEREFKAAADLAPAGSPARVKLADFYLATGKLEQGKGVLREVTEKAPDYLPAWRRLAQVALGEGKHDETQKALDGIFKKAPSDLEGTFLRGRLHLAKRQTTEAIQDFQTVLRLEPKSAPARYQLALAHLAAGNNQQAKTELNEAVSLAPTYADAVLLLASLNLDAGSTGPAIESLEKLIAAQPRLLQAYVLLGNAYLGRREPAKATETFRKFVSVAPRDPRGPHLVGVSLLAQGKRAEATKEFEASLALAPAYSDPLSQLVAIAMADKQPAKALELAKRQVAAEPRSARLQFVLAKVYEARNEPGPAETAYLKAAELEPGFVAPYVELGRIYAGAGKDEQALARLGQALSTDPKNLVALMLTGQIHTRNKNFDKAKEAYEKILAQNPRFAPAANNLAVILGQTGGDKERALQLAQTAKEVAPDDPLISDTLGWILYQRGVNERALGLLRDSAAKLPDNAEIQYHLGMAQLKAGDRDAARKALTQAVSSPVNFTGKNEAQAALRDLR